jgi:hypothetical protein
MIDDFSAVVVDDIDLLLFGVGFLVELFFDVVVVRCVVVFDDYSFKLKRSVELTRRNEILNIQNNECFTKIELFLETRAH